MLTPQLMFSLFRILICFLPETKELAKKTGRPRIIAQNVILAIALITAIFQNTMEGNAACSQLPNATPSAAI